MPSSMRLLVLINSTLPPANKEKLKKNNALFFERILGSLSASIIDKEIAVENLSILLSLALEVIKVVCSLSLL